MNMKLVRDAFIILGLGALLVVAAMCGPRTLTQYSGNCYEVPKTGAILFVSKEGEFSVKITTENYEISRWVSKERVDTWYRADCPEDEDE